MNYGLTSHKRKATVIMQVMEIWGGADKERDEIQEGGKDKRRGQKRYG